MHPPTTDEFKKLIRLRSALAPLLEEDGTPDPGELRESIEDLRAVFWPAFSTGAREALEELQARADEVGDGALRAELGALARSALDALYFGSAR